MPAQLQQLLAELSPAIEGALEAHFPDCDQPQLAACMRHAVFSGGRRMRPTLCLLAAHALETRQHATLPIAAAIEFLHTASLIYDDLPAMDDSPQRRGAPAAHEKFGQGVALLAGLTLISHAFRLLAPAPQLVEAASQCVAAMSAGQAIDLAGGQRDAAHYRKTTALFELAVTAPAIAFGADATATRALAKFGEKLGSAYQSMDDADDEGADALRARARLALQGALDALAPLHAPVLADYARQLLQPVHA